VGTTGSSAPREDTDNKTGPNPFGGKIQKLNARNPICQKQNYKKKERKDERKEAIV
jgi:hypothetical protein